MEAPPQAKKLKKDNNEEQSLGEEDSNQNPSGNQMECSLDVLPSCSSNVTSTFVPQRPKLSFKNPQFSYVEPGSGKRFVWKSLKQIVTQEKALYSNPDIVTYSTLNAPPSLKPPKKYSDISGLEAPYTDPQTKLHYHNAEEFRIIRSLPSDIIQGYLALRGATNIVG